MHGQKGCVHEGGSNQSSNLQFGPWLRAEDGFKQSVSGNSNDANSEGRDEGSKNPTKEMMHSETEGSVGSAVVCRVVLDSGQGHIEISGAQNRIL